MGAQVLLRGPGGEPQWEKLLGEILGIDHARGPAFACNVKALLDRSSGKTVADGATKNDRTIVRSLRSLNVYAGGLAV
tara:strand:+ start:923170 stop:923403 length:234 start_codon:yes stop_codon:yes gene_type:complete